MFGGLWLPAEALRCPWIETVEERPVLRLLAAITVEFSGPGVATSRGTPRPLSPM